MYDVCRNGCYLYDNTNRNPIICENMDCKKPRYKDHDMVEELVRQGVDLNAEVEKPEVYQSMAIASVGSSLSEILIDDELRGLFEEQAELNANVHETPEYVDIFSGSTYKSFLQRNLISHNDICLVIYVDGFPNKHKPSSSQTLIHCIIMNIPSSLR